MKRNIPSHVGSLLSDLMKSIERGFGDGSHHIWEVWGDAVGDHVAKKARPLQFRKGVLTVGAVNSVWMHQLTMLSRTLIESVNRELGEDMVESIRVRQAPSEPVVEEVEEEVPWLDYPVPADWTEELEERLAGVSDPTLRESMRRAGLRGLQKEAYLRGRPAER